jgi:hypothetical protein
MGTSSSGMELSTKMTRAARGILHAESKALVAGGLAAKQVFVTSAPMSPGSRIAGGKWGARFTPPAGAPGRKTILVKYTGQVHFVHNDTRPHVIMSKKAGGTRAARSAGTVNPGRTAVKIGDNFRRSVRHPGTTGKGWFPATRATTKRVVPPIVQRHMVTAPLKGVFR